MFFMFFYLHINVFNIYELQAYTADIKQRKAIMVTYTDRIIISV